MTTTPQQHTQTTGQASQEDAGLAASEGAGVLSSERPAQPPVRFPADKRTTVREAILAFRQLGVPAYVQVDEAEPGPQDAPAPDDYLSDERPEGVRLTIEELVDERMKEPFEYGDLVDRLMKQPQNQGIPRREIERTVMLHMVCSGG